MGTGGVCVCGVERTLGNCRRAGFVGNRQGGTGQEDDEESEEAGTRRESGLETETMEADREPEMAKVGETEHMEEGDTTGRALGKQLGNGAEDEGRWTDRVCHQD